MIDAMRRAFEDAEVLEAAIAALEPTMTNESWRSFLGFLLLARSTAHPPRAAGSWMSKSAMMGA